MALVHEFVLLTQEEWQKEVILNDIRANKDVLEIHDDIILYILDSLKWVPQAKTRYSSEIKYGLNYHGITEIDREGAIVLYNILKAWSDLFKNSPPILQLTGSYYWTEDENINTGAYEVIELDRDKVIEQFNKLMYFAEKVINDNCQILHFGI
jgi:hypothetical protein